MMKRLDTYKKFLEKNFKLTSCPKGVIWTSSELATKLFSSLPIPAYAREDFIYISPDLNAWQDLMVRQLEDKELPEVRAYYEQFGEDELFEILAHELTHYIDLFVDEFDDERTDSIWFEEGMCFYLPRKYGLSKKSFEKITEIEGRLAKAFSEQYDDRSLDDFGAGSYQQSLSGIMFDYWRSYLTVYSLVEKMGGDEQKLFSLYHKWDRTGREMSLTGYFQMNKL
ncbi:hypothetical protein KR50_07530 [Jeotgalibacillus campisalis]|uniref:Uncharacterized protein n=2 Tax=Jeotgalibacillus campisalis TaxID=220754 RepID=A0A0C2VPN5_9BACL|nr:hypothetical protein KR50_07530 [Jeotgalibacillus campisalis]